ncbi:MAG: cysteine peptidase family C39 domain-containing protein [Isosphaeraceae bacterium]
MRMTPGKRIGGLAFGLAGLIGLSALALFSRAAEQQGQTRLDCGVNALFVLLHFEGHPVPYDRLESALPPRRPDGYSMAELSAAARALGLPLDGVKFVKGDKPLDRPAIALFQNARGDHFAVLRPVGTTGTMVQVIDPPHVPAIMDYDRILGSKGWTGRILLPSPPLVPAPDNPSRRGGRRCSCLFSLSSSFALSKGGLLNKSRVGFPAISWHHAWVVMG